MKKNKKKIIWNIGDVFAIPLINGTYSLGQVLSNRWENVAGIALYDEILKDIKNENLSDVCQVKDIISLLEVTREQLDYDVWKIIGNKKVSIPESKLPNEQFRKNNWIGAVTYDAAIAEDFVNAFYCFIPWDDYYNPNYLDELLYDKSKKPKDLLLIKNKKK